MNTKEEYLLFLHNYKKYVGFADWSVVLVDEKFDSTEYAKIGVDMYEKELCVALSDEFEEFSVARKKNILFHELVHGRVELFNKKTETHVKEEEEFLVNDLVRGFEKMCDW